MPSRDATSNASWPDSADSATSVSAQYGRSVAIKRIAVGVDGSDGSQHALSWAADLAKSLDAQILAVHVVPESWLVELNAFQLKTDALVASQRAKLVGEWTDELRKHGVGHSTELVRGNPTTELLRVALEHHADLVVVGGSRHHGPRRDSLLGHTSHRVANHSTVPVVVVPVPVDESDADWVPIPG
jgi:nucleotide-binding universal stress UspA family protein